VLNGKHIHVATGAKPAKLNIPGEEYVTISDQFLESDYLPERIVFIVDDTSHLSLRILLPDLVPGK
jgi:hypothetical protein